MKFREKGHKNLMKLLHARFNEADEDDLGWDEDADDTDEQEDELFEDKGFGDPMDTFVDRGRERRAPYDDYSGDDDTSDDYDSIEDMEDEEDMDDEEMKPSKSDRKNLAVITLGKKIGKGKAKKM